MRNLATLLLLLLALAASAWGGDDDQDEPRSAAEAHEQAQGGSSGEGEAEVQSALRNVAAAVETCYAEQQDYSKCSQPASLDAQGVEFGAEPGQVQIANATPDTYTLTAIAASDTRFELTRDPSGQIQRTCSEPGAGECADDGTW